MPKSYKECSRKYIYYSDYILMPLLCQHKNCPEMSCYLRISQVMLSKSVGERGKKKRSPVLNRMLNSLTSGEIKIRGTDLAEAWRFVFFFLFNQRRYDTLLTSSPCYGRREKSALLRFSVFHLYRVGVTTSNILEILAQKACAIFALHWEASRCQSTKRLAWPRH